MENTTAGSTPVMNDYAYDKLGNLEADYENEIQKIDWTVNGKVKSIERIQNSSMYNLAFDYDASGNRVAKHVLSNSNVLIRSTYYLRDAQGNILATYDFEPGNSSFMLKERVLYGSSRLGLNVETIELMGASAVCTSPTLTRYLGLKQFECTNHLGNVLATVSDRKVPYVSTSTTADYYQPIILSATDYYPGGMLMQGRNFNASSYRFGYNKGSEKDDEITGVTGSHFTTFYREGDTKLLTWWSVDPKADEQPWQSPYSYMDENPVKNNDPDGDCPWCIVSAAIDYGFQVYDNYQAGKGGYDAWVGDVNFVSVGLSAIPGGGLVKTALVETAKAAVEWKPNAGVKLETDLEKVAKSAAINTAISKGSEMAATKIKVTSSDEALKKANKDVVTSNNKVTTAERQLTKKPNSPVKATNLKTAQGAAQQARNKQVATQMANKSIGKVNEKVVEETVNTGVTRAVKSNEKRK